MPSCHTRKHKLSFSFRRTSAWIFSANLAFFSCCLSIFAVAGNPAELKPPAIEGQMTQSEAEQSALASFAQHNPDCTVKSYTFMKLMHIQDARPDLAMNGFFLCGEMEYTCFGETHASAPVMVNFANNKFLSLILYDYPERGAHPASSLCEQVEEITRSR